MARYRRYFFLLFLFFCQRAVAWGPEGHAIVGRIAMQFLKDDVRANVLHVLDGMPVDTAANWMDIMKSNPDYEFMRSWHYIDFDYGTDYAPSTDDNIINHLLIAFNELRHRKTLCAEQVKTDLLILFHLMGDLHQPLHAGYPDDMGGNKRLIRYDTLQTNLHSFWDVDIIRYRNITLASCMEWYRGLGSAALVDSVKGIHPVLWMKETRALLPVLYGFDGADITAGYLQKAEIIVKRQLVLAGLRLAAMLNQVFGSTAPLLDMSVLRAKFNNGIDIKDAAANAGRKVTVCERVYGVKETDHVTFINLGAAFPNSPLTVVIFEKDRKRFPAPAPELYNDRNVCVQGEIVLFKNKPEIIVTSPDQLIVQ